MIGNSRIFWTAKLTALLALAGACSLGGPLRKDMRAASFNLGPLPNVWRKDTTDPQVDQAFLRDGAVIAVSSLCNRYEDVTLDSLKNDLINPIESHEITSEEKTTLDGREGLMTKVKGKMDGVPVEAEFLTLRKDECLFDFSLISRNRISPSDDADFAGLIKGFHYAGGQVRE